VASFAAAVNFKVVVIVMRGHAHDKTVLAQALRTRACYIGMIGSRRKTSLVFNQLQEEGFGEERLSRVHAPIGLDIGSETPQEIALSIVAEMVQVRSGKRGTALEERRRVYAAVDLPYASINRFSFNSDGSWPGK